MKKRIIALVAALSTLSGLTAPVNAKKHDDEMDNAQLYEDSSENYLDCVGELDSNTDPYNVNDVVIKSLSGKAIPFYSQDFTDVADAKEILMGDVNDDAEVDSMDALYILLDETGVYDLDDAQKLAGDVDGNGEVDSTDALCILYYEIGEIALDNGPWFKSADNNSKAEATLKLVSASDTQLVLEAGYSGIDTLTQLSLNIPIAADKIAEKNGMKDVSVDFADGFHEAKAGYNADKGAIVLTGASTDGLSNPEHKIAEITINLASEITSDLTLTYSKAIFTDNNRTAYKLSDGSVIVIPVTIPKYEKRKVYISAPSVSVPSGKVAYGTEVHISGGLSGYSYTVNGEYHFEWFGTTLVITEDTVLTVRGTIDVMEEDVDYVQEEVTYYYTVDPDTISNKCGDDLTWAFENGTITISGSGEMDNWYRSELAPWYNRRSEITKVIIEDGVTSVGNSAFHGYESLSEVILPKGLNRIGERAFSGCQNLKDITLPEGLKTIDESAFYGCSSFQDLNLPESLEIIGRTAFYGCENLTKIQIPKNVSDIDSHAFSSCYKLTDIEVDLNNSSYCSVDGVLYNKDKTDLIQCPAKKTSVNIPDGTTAIKEGAFSDCRDLADITIPDSVIEISGYSFNGTAYYENQDNWIDGVLYIGNHLIAANVTGEYKIRPGTVCIADNVFEYCGGLTGVIMPSSMVYIGNEAFKCCWDLNKIVLPEGVIGIGNQAFYGCDKLAEIIIPNSIIKIGYRAFNRTAYFEDINNWDSSTLYLGNCLIGILYVDGINKISVREGTRLIADSVFGYSDQIEEICLPTEIDYIGSNAFADCENLKDVYYAGTEQQWNEVVIGEGNDSLLNAALHLGEYHDSGTHRVRFSVSEADVTVYTDESMIEEAYEPYMTKNGELYFKLSYEIMPGNGEMRIYTGNGKLECLDYNESHEGYQIIVTEVYKLSGVTKDTVVSAGEYYGPILSFSAEKTEDNAVLTKSQARAYASGSIDPSYGAFGTVYVAAYYDDDRLYAVRSYKNEGLEVEYKWDNLPENVHTFRGFWWDDNEPVDQSMMIRLDENYQQ